MIFLHITAAFIAAAPATAAATQDDDISNLHKI